MRIIARLKKVFTRWRAAELEAARCSCGQLFLRRVAPHPDLKCDACRDTEMDLWIARIRGLS